jgi:hypothetical protein
MRRAARSIIPVTLLLLTSACASVPGEQVRRIEDTRDILAESDFCFTISPDDHWLVFFKRGDDQAQPQTHRRYGDLHVLDLRGGDIRLAAVPEDQGLGPIMIGDACWKPDSSECFLPPAPAEASSIASPKRGLLIHIGNQDMPGLLHRGENIRVDVPIEEPKMTEQLTCSDCFPRMNDVALMKQYVDEQYLHLSDDPREPNETTMQIVSPDGTKIFFQKRPERTDQRREFQDVALYELDIATGKERRLIAFRDEHPTIDHLRLSPDGKRLAYQLTTGFGALESRPNVYVLDLKTLGNRHIATADGDHTMHWNRASDKLYFYCQNCLYVATIPKAPQPRAPTRPRQQTVGD